MRVLRLLMLVMVTVPLGRCGVPVGLAEMHGGLAAAPPAIAPAGTLPG